MNRSIKQCTQWAGIGAPVLLMCVALVAPTQAAIDPQQIPFIVQAPDNAWEVEPWANLCEEASLAMVDIYYDNFAAPEDEAEMTAEYVRGIERSLADRQKILLDVVMLRRETVGDTFDETPADMARLVADHFAWTAEVAVPDKERIIAALADSRPVIAPVHGQALFRNQYTAPGPDYHVVVLVAYNEQDDTFTVNDPGTNRGKGIVYSADAVIASQQQLVADGYLERPAVVFTYPEEKAAPAEPLTVLMSESGPHDLSTQEDAAALSAFMGFLEQIRVRLINLVGKTVA